MAIDRSKAAKLPHSLMEIFNSSWDDETKMLVFQSMGYDGQNLQRPVASDLADIIQTSGTDTFVGFASPGTTAATAKWKALKIDSAGTVTYADGDANYDNVATDLTALTYS